MIPHSATHFPPDQAVYLMPQDLDGTGWNGLAAIVAPTFTPGVHHVGVLQWHDRSWRFIEGPSVVRTSRVWRKLIAINAEWECATLQFREKTSDLSIPTHSLDDFTDLVVGEVKP